MNLTSTIYVVVATDRTTGTRQIVAEATSRAAAETRMAEVATWADDLDLGVMTQTEASDAGFE